MFCHISNEALRIHIYGLRIHIYGLIVHIYGLRIHIYCLRIHVYGLKIVYQDVFFSGLVIALKTMKLHEVSHFLIKYNYGFGEVSLIIIHKQDSATAAMVKKT